MTDFNFHIPQPFDQQVADEGVDFEFFDKNKVHWGTFKCLYLDANSRKIKLAQDRIKQKYARELRLGTEDNEAIGLELFLDAILVAWSEVKDGKGKEVPYSKEAAEAYFANPTVRAFVLPYLLEAVQDYRNFQKVSAGAISGN